MFNRPSPSYIQSDTDLLRRVPTTSLSQRHCHYSDPTVNVPHPSFSTDARLLEAESNETFGSHDNLDDSSDDLLRAKEQRLKSEFEIRNTHYTRQLQYAQETSDDYFRRMMDVDFDGMLNIVKGCNNWQFLVYLIISAHQVPHAMFNLSVVYMMYQPDHWCKIPGFNAESFANSTTNYSWDEVLNSNIAFPKTVNKQRGDIEWHDQCHYYKRDYMHLKNLTWEQIQKLNLQPTETVKCKNWEFDKSVMHRTVVTEWNRVCDNNWSRAHVHSSYSLGYLLGCLVGGYVSDNYGRKTAIFGFSIMSLAFGFMLQYATEFEVFLVIRFCLAASNEAADLAAYVLCMEITGTQYRSVVGSLLQAPWACGYAFLALISYITKSWVGIQTSCVILHCLALVALYFLPESPRWLISHGKFRKAEKIIRSACAINKSELPGGLSILKHGEKKDWMKHGENPSFSHMFRAPELRNRNILLFVIWMATALVYYGLVIALSDQSSPGRAVFDGNFFLNNAMAGCIELPTLLFCVVLLRCGRKKSQMITLYGAGLILLAAIVALSQKHVTGALVFMLLAKTFIQAAFNILYIFTSELNPTIIRNIAVGFASMMARMGAGASGYIAILSDVTLPIVPMFIFAIFSLIAGSLVFFLPETENSPLPDTLWDAVVMYHFQSEKPCGASTIKTDETDAYIKLMEERKLEQEKLIQQRQEALAREAERKLTADAHEYHANLETIPEYNDDIPEIDGDEPPDANYEEASEEFELLSVPNANSSHSVAHQ